MFHAEVLKTRPIEDMNNWNLCQHCGSYDSF